MAYLEVQYSIAYHMDETLTCLPSGWPSWFGRKKKQKQLQAFERAFCFRKDHLDTVVHRFRGESQFLHVEALSRYSSTQE